MRIVFHATLAELEACGLLGPKAADVPPFELVNLRLRKDPYSDAYRLCADVLDRREAM
ncbi:hypothetical protein ACFYSC_18290 [Streptosporangium sp. NPDC004379]|uniref:hypothetical protein n=1 Tax=Streptosporangium sp. NPDC004379 TaxID=3366189 RepID=UPI00368C487D